MTSSVSHLMADVTVNTVQPLTFTHHGVQGLPLMVRGVNAEGHPQRTVYLPAGQLRGRIRHEAALAHMRAKGQKVKLEEAYMLALGQDLRPEEDDEPEAIRLGDQIKFRKDNPFLDLFGTWKVASRLFVSHLLPETNVGPDRISHIRRDLDSNEEVMAELDESEQDRLYDRQSKQALASKVGSLIKVAEGALRAAKKAKDTQKIDELQAKLAEFEALRKTHKGGDESDNTKHLVELQVVPAGLTLMGRLTVKAPLASDLTTLLTALDGISRSPMLGAQRARGCGEINGTATFRTPDGRVLVVVRFGGFVAAAIEWTEAGRAFVGEQAAA